MATRTTDFKTLVDSVDMTADVPVVYAFGGSVPNENVQLGGDTRGFSVGRAYGNALGRTFVEFKPYSWSKK